MIPIPARSAFVPSVVDLESALSRRRLLGGLAGAALLTACGSDGEPAASGPPSSGDAGFPRTISHGLGAAEIPAPPTRIVSTADRDQLDVLLAMGVEPVQFGYSGDYEVAAPWLDAELVASLEQADMASAFEPNLELIAAARPDLIVDAWADAALHDKLATIAPTIEIKSSEEDSWQDAQLMAGRACGTEEAAQAAVDETRAVIAEQADRLAQYRGQTIAIAFRQGDQLIVLPGTAIGGRIVAELGMDVLGTDDGAPATYSWERVRQVLGEADVILSFDYGLAEQESSELFRTIPAVRAGRYVVADQEVATACYQESTLSLRWAAAPVADLLAQAAAGDGRRLQA